MLELARVDDRDRLESAMGMLPDAARTRRWFERRGRRIVQHEERADMLAEAFLGKDGAHGEAVADPVRP